MAERRSRHPTPPTGTDERTAPMPEIRPSAQAALSGVQNPPPQSVANRSMPTLGDVPLQDQGRIGTAKPE